MPFTLPSKDPHTLSKGFYKTDAFSRKRLYKVTKEINSYKKSFFVNTLYEAYAIKKTITEEDVNPRYIANLLSINPSKDISPYKDIEYLPSSSYISLNNHNVEKIFCYEPFENGKNINNENELIHYFKEEFILNLERIVQHNNKPIACEHSSGLDSNLIISSLIKELGTIPNSIFTWSNISSGEESLIKKFCSEYEIPESNNYHLSAPSNFKEYIHHQKEIIKKFGAPTIGNFDLRCMSDLSSAGCKLFFSGLGGDQALTNLGGNISIDLLHNFNLKQYIVWNGGLRKSLKGLVINLIGLLSLRFANTLIPSIREQKYRFENFNNLLKNNLTEYSYKLFGKFLKEDKYINNSFLSQRQWIINNVLSDQIYIRAFEESILAKSFGMEKQYPMLNENLIATLLNHCSQIFSEKENNKRYIFRKAFSDLLPYELIENPNKERIIYLSDLNKFCEEVKNWNRVILQENINSTLERENLFQFFDLNKICEEAEILLNSKDATHHLLFSYNQSFATLRKISDWFLMIRGY
tara:strand:+ start:7452 stop:9023 length:1572 start_codon:yes stop_codon:yes gene_type:complete